MLARVFAYSTPTFSNGFAKVSVDHAFPFLGKMGATANSENAPYMIPAGAC